MARSKIKLPGAESHYESPRKRRKRPKPKMQPPLTPMIDVTFQLLLFFLIAANFRDEGNIPGSIPKLGAIGPTEIKTDVMPVCIIVRQEGAGRESRPIYGVKVASEVIVRVADDLPIGEYRKQMAQGLYDELVTAKIRANNPKTPALVKPEVDYSGGTPGQYPYVRWQYVAEAYNQAVRAEFKEIGFQWQSDIGEETE